MVKLLNNQVKSLNTLKNRPYNLDMSDPGTGKTLVYLSHIKYLIESGEINKALIVAPKTLLQSAWGNDIDKFMPHIPYVVARAENRDAAFRSDAAIYIVNYDGLTDLVNYKPAFYSRIAECVVYDEATALKHRTSVRSKAAYAIAKNSKYRYALSASFMANDITHIWNPTRTIDFGKTLGPVFGKFRESVCVPRAVSPTSVHMKWVEKEGARDAVYEVLKDISIRHRIEDCVDIPQNQEILIPWDLPDPLQKAYKKFERESILEFKDATVIGINAAAAQAKLQQIASGAVYNDKGEYSTFNKDRYELIHELVQSVPHQCVIFYLWNHQKDNLAKIFSAKKTPLSVGTEESTISDFLDGKSKALLVHPRSAAHGLTLVNAKTTIWVSPVGDWELKNQGKRRIVRIGQDEKTQNVVIYARNTIEERIVQRADDRERSDSAFLSLLADYFSTQ